MTIEPTLPPTKSRAEVLIERIRGVFSPSHPVTCQWCGHGHKSGDVCPRCRAPQRLRGGMES